YPDPRLHLLRLDGGVSRLHVPDRADPDSAGVHHLLYAAGRRREIPPRLEHGGDHADADLYRVRPAARHPMAADFARRLVPDLQDDTERVILSSLPATSFP